MREIRSQQFMDVHTAAGPARAGAGIEEGGQVVLMQSAPMLVVNLDGAARFLSLFRSVCQEARAQR